MNSDSAGRDKSSRGIGLPGALSIGIGGMIGGGIFAVLGEAVSLAHTATPIAFLIAGSVALLTSYSYAKLSVHFQNQGGTVYFIDKAFGIDLATGAVNLVLWLSYLVTISLYAVAFGSYALTFFSDGDIPWLRHTLISAAIVVPAAINLFNADFVGKSETVIVAAKLLILSVVIVSGFFFIHLPSSGDVPHTDTLGIVVAGMIIFVAYEGFELIANAAQDVRNPERTLPLAFYGSVILVVLLYALVAYVVVGTVPESLVPQVKDFVLAEAAKPALGDAGFTLVAIAALLATLSAINATIYGNARLGYVLAMDGELPDLLDRKVWNKPVAGVLAVAILSLLIANLIDLTAIAIIASAGFLLIFAVTNAAATWLAREIGAKWWIPALACFACLASLTVLLLRTYTDQPRAIWIFAGAFLASLCFELIYPRLSGRPMRMNGISE
ncbi:MAG TPA: APC family permease [Mariprofundaceae bacterium]|nr:APC family permease [Mariprofundaceae bacterium]